VIQQDGVGGLQFLHDKEWVDVPVVDQGIVINAGDYLHRLSGGRYHSPIHRVLCPSNGLERTSFVFFYYPGYYSKMPSIDSIRQRESSVDGGYNTLSTEIEGNMNLTFGDFILRKWQGVSV
jgi:isopenicillin N synthase-like dioxygenase